MGRFKLSPDSKHYVDDLTATVKKALYKEFRKLSKIPPEGDIKPLAGAKNTYRARVGDIRILFTVDGDIIRITKIAQRGQAYK